MTTALKTPSEKTTPRASTFEQVRSQVEQLCGTLLPGDRLPTQLEMMALFNASGRSVLRALDELQWSGRVVRRQGSGTVVAEPSRTNMAPPAVRLTATDNQTIVVVRTPDSSFFDRCMDSLFRHTNEAGLSLVCQIIDSGADLDRVAPLVTDDSLGYILFRFDLAPLARRIYKTGAHVVIVGALPVNVTHEVPCVYGDHERGAYLATRHLIDLGHRRLTFCAPDKDYQETLRWAGHQKALREAVRKGITVESSTFTFADVDRWEGDLASVAAYFRRADAPTAVIPWNDREAAKLTVILNRACVKVPEEVSVIGYDNMPEALLVHPQLTTVDHSIDWQLDAALDLLTRPNRPGDSHTTVVMPVLIPRGSTAPPRGANSV